MTTKTDIQIRTFEYYGLIEIFDNLYAKSKANVNHKQNLYDLVVSENNILCAYRSIKRNKGSETSGNDKITIENYKEFTKDEFVSFIRESFDNYEPDKIRRVEIPKPNGRTRPLGIPTMRDRIIQQCIKQVIEPILEAKFHNHSYGFRPNRSSKHAIARTQFLVNISKLHYVVDIDIKSFFDNVNHNKLIKILHKNNVRDKRILSIIRKILKAEVVGLGVQDKGTPQGGILSPLLSNAYLNELDWWISNQWETFETNYDYRETADRYRSLRKRSNLKEMYIVRYADDFKIFTKSYKTAFKIKQATQNFLKHKLNLDIAEDKTKITNLKKNKSEFLGFYIRAIPKKNKYVARTGISDNAKDRITREYRSNIRKLARSNKPKDINRYNSYIMGVKNYYKYATDVYNDLADIEFRILKSKYCRFKGIAKSVYPRDLANVNITFKKYCSLNYKTWQFKGGLLHTFTKQSYTPCQNYNQKISRYTPEGRKELNKLNPSIENEITRMLESRYNTYRSLEYVDNRISKYSMQNGKCAITKEFLTSFEIHCHHIKPKYLGGTDDFNNLVIIHKDLHELIHMSDKERIKERIIQLNLSTVQIKKLNEFRIKSQNIEITI